MGITEMCMLQWMFITTRNVRVKTNDSWSNVISIELKDERMSTKASYVCSTKNFECTGKENIIDAVKRV